METLYFELLPPSGTSSLKRGRVLPARRNTVPLNEEGRAAKLRREFEKRASPKPSPKGKGCERARGTGKHYANTHRRDTACRVRLARGEKDVSPSLNMTRCRTECPPGRKNITRTTPPPRQASRPPKTWEQYRQTLPLRMRIKNITKKQYNI